MRNSTIVSDVYRDHKFCSLSLTRFCSLSHSTFHRFKSLCNVRFLLLSSASLLHIIYYNTGLFCASSNFRIFNSLIPPECSSFQRSVFLFAIVILMLMILRVFDKPNVWMANGNIKLEKKLNVAFLTFARRIIAYYFHQFVTA